MATRFELMMAGHKYVSLYEDYCALKSAINGTNLPFDLSFIIQRIICPQDEGISNGKSSLKF